MSNVYLVTDGDYSDYRIEAAFSTEEKARQALDECTVCGRIETWELDAATDKYPQLKRGWRVWSVSISNDGTTEAEETTLRRSFKELEDVVFLHSPRISKWGCYVLVFADSEERAVKRASELRAQAIAEKSVKGEA